MRLQSSGPPSPAGSYGRVRGEDDDRDFGAGAGFYLDATRQPWSAHYRMYACVTAELRALVASRFPVRSRRRPSRASEDTLP